MRNALLAALAAASIAGIAGAANAAGGYVTSERPEQAWVQQIQGPGWNFSVEPAPGRIVNGNHYADPSTRLGADAMFRTFAGVHNSAVFGWLVTAGPVGAKVKLNGCKFSWDDLHWVAAAQDFEFEISPLRTVIVANTPPVLDPNARTTSFPQFWVCGDMSVR
jgi:hypothetical protein